MNVLKNFSKAARRSLARAVVAGAVIGTSGVLAISASGAAGPTWPYGVWGNAGHEALGDCPEAAGANLVRNLFPTAPITTAQVEGYYRNDSSLGSLGILEGYGYGGHRIDGYTPVTTRAQFIAGANHGGLYAVVLSGEHAVAVIGASTRGVTFVSWGIVFNEHVGAVEGLAPGFRGCVAVGTRQSNDDYVRAELRRVESDFSGRLGRFYRDARAADS